MSGPTALVVGFIAGIVFLSAAQNLTWPWGERRAMCAQVGESWTCELLGGEP